MDVSARIVTLELAETFVISRSARDSEDVVVVELRHSGVSEAIQPTLGNLIGDGQRGVIALGEGWWTWAFPAMVLLLILVCVNLVGDGIADALRPTGRR